MESVQIQKPPIMDQNADFIMGKYRFKKVRIATVVFVMLLFLVCWINVPYDWISWKAPRPASKDKILKFKSMKEENQDFSVWPLFENKPRFTKEWYRTNCFKDKYLEGIGQIKDAITQWKETKNSYCREVFAMFDSVISVTQRTGSLVIPDTFATKVKKWLGNKEALFEETKHQTITFIYNEFTHENTIFNPLRSKRPISKPDQPEQEYVDELVKNSEPTCDFCAKNYQKFTAYDTFGRIEAKHSFTAANAFKYDAWHSLIAWRKHHPHNWTMDQFLDVCNTALMWMNKVHKKDPSYRFPIIMWDLLPHASASQIHPHMHGSLDTQRYYGSIESWRVAAEKFYHYHGTSYFTAMVEFHTALGLSVTYGTATAYASITPKKDDEIVIMSREANKDFFKMLYFVTRAFIDDMKKLCFSTGIALPRMGSDNERGQIPAIVRIITRGPIASVRSDISSLELFAASNVNKDPYEAIKFIRESVKKRSQS